MSHLPSAVAPGTRPGHAQLSLNETGQTETFSVFRQTEIGPR